MSVGGRALLVGWGLLLASGACCATPIIELDSPVQLRYCGMTVGATLSNDALARDGNFIYLASFDAAGIHGSLRKMVIATESDGTPRIASTAQWDAADVLTGAEGNPPRLSFRERKIFIGKQSGTNWATVPFEWDVLSESQRMLLSTATAKETSARQWVDYLRGARDLEIGRPQGSLRHRKNLLGDIVNSQPLYVGAPTSDISGAEYQAFHARYGSRRKAVYVGANDGMLHAFDAEDGHELFAYIPNVLLPSLSQLTRPDYRHHSYVDGRLAVAEALVGGEWRTILAAGMGGGAQGVFALDVSDPSDFSGGRGALWEFTDRDDPDMGNVLGTPMIARFMTSKVKGVPQYKYFAVVANGVNSYQVDGDKRYSIGAVGALFLLALDKPASAKWQEGVNYFKFKTPAGEPDLANGLMSPAAITDGSGVVRFIYAGDLQGNLWRFDFDGGMPKQNVETSIVSIFTAVDEKKKRQPIVTRPAIVFAPGGYVVLFGTGKFLERRDAAAASFSVQSFYGIYDIAQKNYSVSGRDELAQRTMRKEEGGAVRVIGNAFNYGATASTRRGWYVDFAASDITGERSVSDPVLADGKIFFNSLLQGGSCADSSGRNYVLNALSGLSMAAASATAAGMTFAPLLLESRLAVGTGVGGGKGVGQRRRVILDFSDRKTGAGESLPPTVINDVRQPDGRLSWREIVNWQEVRGSATK